MVTPIFVYDNADLLKLQCITDNKGKSGVYRWTNKVNGKVYIDSSVDLGKRLGKYYNLSYISSNNMLISKALIKYGYGSFSLDILEYSSRSNVLLREQYYLDLLKPEYNILNIAGSILGYIHTENTLAKMRESRLNWTEEQKTKIINHLKIHNASSDQVDKSRQRLIEYNKSKGVQVEIIDTRTNEISSYTSFREAANAIGCVHRTILLAERRQKEGSSKLIKNRYLIKTIRREFHSFTRSLTQAVNYDNQVKELFYKKETLSPSSPASEIMPPYASSASPSKADVLSKDITPQTIASFIMGDGYFADGCVKICTDNFTEQEVLDLIQVLSNKFAIRATANKRTNSNGKVLWRIRISKSSMEKLKLLVGPYMMPEMLYKLGIKK